LDGLVRDAFLGSHGEHVSHRLLLARVELVAGLVVAGTDQALLCVGGGVQRGCMKRSDLAKTAFLVDLKLESVTLPSFSMLVSYFVASGLKFGLMNVSTEFLWPIEHFGLSRNLLEEFAFGL
jgi:hypothetical protein